MFEAGTRIVHFDAQDVVHDHGDLDGRLTLLEARVSHAVRHELADQQGDVVQHVCTDGARQGLDPGSRFPARNSLGRKSDVEGDRHGDLPVVGRGKPTSSRPTQPGGLLTLEREGEADPRATVFVSVEARIGEQGSDQIEPSRTLA